MTRRVSRAVILRVHLVRASAAELDRLRTDTARERVELRELLEDRARTLAEGRDTERRRTEQAKADLDVVRAELAQLLPKTGTADTPSASRRRRVGQSEKWVAANSESPTGTISLGICAVRACHMASPVGQPVRERP